MRSLVFEAGAAEEFAEEGGGGDVGFADGGEVAEEAAEAVGFGVFADVVGHGAQEFFAALFHDS